MGLGLGQGYKNITPLDPQIHSLSAQGVRVKRVLLNLPNATVYQDDVIDPNSAEFLQLREEHPEAIIQEVPLEEIGKVSMGSKSETDDTVYPRQFK